jgi:hypothetical protein
MKVINLLKDSLTNSKYKFIIWAVIIIMLIRLLFIGIMGLMPQDAYYYFYGEHLALSYYDHPPAIAYILRFFTDLFGKKVYVIKLADSVVTLLTILSFYKLSLLFLGRHVAQKALILFFSTLMVTLLSLVSTPDVPLMLFWSLSLITLYNAIFLEKNIYWIWSGIMMGLAFDSKYTGLFLPAGVVLFFIMSNKYRKLLFSPWFLSALLLFIVTISPVIIWNVQNNFASFRFQSSARMASMDGFHISLVNFLGVVGHQSAILVPILLFALVIFLYKSFKKYLVNRHAIPAEQLFLFCFFVPVFLGFFAISFIYWVKINWMMPAYISGIILISTYFNAKWIRYQVVFSVVIHVILAVEVAFYPLLIKSDDTWEGWGAFAGRVEDLKIAHPDAFVFSADDYKTSAVLNFYMDDMIYGRNIIGEPALQFDFVGSDLEALHGKNAIFINSIPNFKSEQKENLFPPALSSYFDSVEELDPIIIKKDHQTVRKFLIFYCKHYHSWNKPVQGVRKITNGLLPLVIN